MKRTIIIRVAIVTYLLAMIGAFWGVEKYIKAKDNRLRDEIHSKLGKVFEKDRYIDIAYSGYKVGHEKIDIPRLLNASNISDSLIVGLNIDKKTMESNHKKRQEEWNETYGNLFRLHRIKYKRSDWSGPYDCEDGWNLVTIEHDYDGVYQTWIFPYAVGYIKQDYAWSYDYLPSVENAVEDALEFYTTNEQSLFIDDFQKGCFERIWSKIRDCNNEYYYLFKDPHPRFYRTGRALFDDYKNYYRSSNEKPYQAGYMYNGYYKVFIGETQPITWTIKKVLWNPDEEDKKKLWMYWGIGLTALVLLTIVPLWIIDKKRNKIKEECLYDKLKRLCNPANFLKDYNKENIDKANTIYQQLMEIEPDNKEALMALQSRAVTELSITLIETEKLKELIEKVNPQRFMKPYNAEKVGIANDLYSRLNKEGLTFEEFIEIEGQSKIL